MKTKSTLATILLFTLFGLSYQVQAQSLQWVKTMTGTSGSNSGGEDLILDASGNVYTVGDFYGTCDFDPGAGIFNLTATGYNDVFVSKLDASGNFVWAVSMGGVSATFAGAIALDASNNVYITGYFRDTSDFDPGVGTTTLISNGDADIYVCKLDALGNLAWAKNMGGNDFDEGKGIAVDGSGNVYTVGDFQDTADFDPGAPNFDIISGFNVDIFVSKLDASGNFVWAKSFRGPGGQDYAADIAVDNVGTVYTTGGFRGTADFDPSPVTSNLSSSGDADIFISKLNSSGNFVWAKKLGSAFDDYGEAIELDNLGNFYITGRFMVGGDYDPGAGVVTLTSAGAIDIFVIKFDTAGTFAWVNSMGGTGSDSPFNMGLDGAGNVYTTGYFEGTADLDPGVGIYNLTVGTLPYDLYMSKLDASGNFQMAARLNGISGSYGIDGDASGNIVLTGNFAGTVDFDPGPAVFNVIASIDSSDGNAFITKLSGGAVGIDNENSLAMNTDIYPNPSSGIFTIDNNQNVSVIYVEVYNMMGEKILQVQNTNQVNLSNFAKGMYVIRISDGVNTFNKNVIVE